MDKISLSSVATFIFNIISENAHTYSVLVLTTYRPISINSPSHVTFCKETVLIFNGKNTGRD